MSSSCSFFSQWGGWDSPLALEFARFLSHLKILLKFASSYAFFQAQDLHQRQIKVMWELIQGFLHLQPYLWDHWFEQRYQYQAQPLVQFELKQWLRHHLHQSDLVPYHTEVAYELDGHQQRMSSCYAQSCSCSQLSSFWCLQLRIRSFFWPPSSK